MARIPNSIGLALSGGGYRASLFHLGVTKRLHELGILQKITHLSSVSGGSIFSAYLADAMIKKGNGKTLSFESWEKDIAAPFIAFVNSDIRTKLILKYFIWGQFNTNLRANALAEQLSLIHI